jgi:hypothetical protein
VMFSSARAPHPHTEYLPTWIRIISPGALCISPENAVLQLASRASWLRIPRQHLGRGAPCP